MPNGNILTSTAQATMNITDIPTTARIIHLFPDLHSKSLLSIGQLCDEGCTATFDDQQVIIRFNTEILLQGERNHDTGLWMIPVPIVTPRQHQANNVNATTKIPELVAFAHAALFSPALTTLQKAIDLNFLHDFPGLTSKALKDHPPISAATIKGHLDQVRQNKQPTVHPSEPLPLLPLSTISDRTMSNFSTINKILQHNEEDIFPQEPLNQRSHHCYTSVIANTQTGQVFSDQTGRFLSPASSGATQLFVLYDYDSNSIHTIRFKPDFGVSFSGVILRVFG